ncbi:MAG: hypothetical protein LBV58_01285 [Acholeplasmatales bacterium]|jgi:primosomal protein N' (replication factor Y)|nr:hypothetical protein [Acholeplasmatales bacterium]
MIASVIIDLEYKGLLPFYTYTIPSNLEDTCKVSSLVLVPFSDSNMERLGLVIKISDSSNSFENETRKEIIRVTQLANETRQKTIQILMNRYYYEGYNLFKSVVPSTSFLDYRFQVKNLIHPLFNDFTIKFKDKFNSKGIWDLKESEKKYLSLLEKDKDLEVNRHFNVSSKKKSKVEKESNFNFQNIILDDKELLLYEKFRESNNITSNLDIRSKVYLKLIKDFYEIGKKVIISFASTYEAGLASEYFNLFFPNVIKVDGEITKRQEEKINKDSFMLIIGVEKIFTLPINNIGLIILKDSEISSNLYVDRYLLAKIKQEINDSKLVLSSLFGESLYLGHDTYLKVNQDSNNNIDLIIDDKRKNIMDGDISFFSKRVLGNISNTLNSHGKVLVVHNILNEGRYLTCNHCHKVFICEKCNSLMVIDKDSLQIVCSKCGDSKGLKKLKENLECPICKKGSFSYKKPGIDILKKELSSIFKDQKISQLESKNASRFEKERLVIEGDYDILIATSLIEKEFYQKFSLIYFYDCETFFKDLFYNTGEISYYRYLKIISNLEDKGSVLISTFDINHPFLNLIKKDLKDNLIYFDESRKSSSKEPYSHNYKLNIEGSSIFNTYKELCLYKKITENESITLIGPVQDKDNYYLYTFIVKTNLNLDEEINFLRNKYKVEVISLL